MSYSSDINQTNSNINDIVYTHDSFVDELYYDSDTDEIKEKYYTSPKKILDLQRDILDAINNINNIIIDISQLKR